MDWGSKRIGAAISDEDGKIAFPLDKVIETKKAINEIKYIIARYKVAWILIGIPKTTSGNEGHSAMLTKNFADKLSRETGIPQSLADERFSSVEARKLLHSQGLHDKKQRQIIDNVAAQIILQKYLDAK